MAQASQCIPNRTLWIGFAVGAPQCASTIHGTTISPRRATCKILDKEVGMNHYQYYERKLSAWMENMWKSNVDSSSIWIGWIKSIPDFQKLYQMYCNNDQIEWFRHTMFLRVLEHLKNKYTIVQ